MQGQWHGKELAEAASIACNKASYGVVKICVLRNKYVRLETKKGRDIGYYADEIKVQMTVNIKQGKIKTLKKLKGDTKQTELYVPRLCPTW